MAQTKQEEKTIELEKAMAVDKGKSDLVEKLVFILFPVCVSAIGWLLTQVSELSDKVTVLQNKVAIVVNAENKAIPVQGTTIELEELKAKKDKQIVNIEKALMWVLLNFVAYLASHDPELFFQDGQPVYEQVPQARVCQTPQQHVHSQATY